MNKELKKYLAILKKVREGREVSKEDLSFFAEYTPEVDSSKMEAIIASGDFSNPAEVQAALQEASVALQTSPEYKDKISQAAADNEGTEVAGKITQGLNMLLGLRDISQSKQQINASNAALAKSKRPSRPVVPQRDQYLQQALRSAEQGTFDSERAMAPVRAEIQDQYLTDQANAKTASTGQSGAFGAYSQLAANRRNRAALNLAPIQDQVRSREQQRYDNLLGMRLDETQNMFQNQASTYPYELQQYRAEQDAAGELGAMGRENLRNSVFGVASQIPQAVGDEYAKRRYRKLYDQLSMYSPEAADIGVKGNQYLDQQLYTQQFNPFG
jgi:hypothetical protein